MAVTSQFPIRAGLLEGNLNCAGFGFENLNKATLQLNKADVGLDLVDNTSDADKPTSGPTLLRLAEKEDFIQPATNDKFLRGDKTFVHLGSLAHEDGNTNLSQLSSKGSAPDEGSLIGAKRNDYGQNGSAVETYLTQLGVTVPQPILTGLPGAGVGALVFSGASYAVIKTDSPTILVFGTNNVIRGWLNEGLNIGIAIGDVAPAGPGSIKASGDIIGDKFFGIGSNLTGFTKEQIPIALRSTEFPSVSVFGLGGGGYIDFAAQINPPTTNFAHIWSDDGGRLSMYAGGGSGGQFSAKLGTRLITASRDFDFPDVDGTFVVGTQGEGWAAWTGSGSKATKLVSTATATDCAAAIKEIIDLLLAYGMIKT